MSVPLTQLAYCYDNKTKSLVVETERPVVHPSQGQVLVKIEGAGLCSSDLHVLSPHGGPISNNGANDKERFVMGHEIAGQIIEIGKDTRTSHKVGDRVCLAISHSCGECLDCRQGRDNTCSSRAYGLNQDGGFQQYLLVDHLRTMVPIPDNVSYAQACSACDAIVTPFHAVQKVAHLLTKPTVKVLVLGIGGLGFNALQILHNFPVDITAIDTKEDLRESALNNGAKRFGTSTKEVAEQSKDFDGKYDIVFDFVGGQKAYDSYFAFLNRRAKVVMVGLADHMLTIHNLVNCMREIEFIFSFGGHSEEMIQVMDWISLGKLDPIVTEVPMTQLTKYLALLRDGKVTGRIVFQPDL